MKSNPTNATTVELSSGISVYYERYGQGPALLLIAGTGCDHLFWSFQVPIYAANYDVIVVDQRGSGKSEISEEVESYSASVMADDMARFLDRIGVSAANVAGHSLGSCIAQELAIRHPEKVLSLQLHATWARSDQWLKQAFIGTTRYPLERGDLQATFKTVSMWMLSPGYLETRQPRRVAEMVTQAFIANPNLQANVGMLGHLWADEIHDTVDRLNRISCPVLVTAGEFDYLIPARYGREVSRAIGANASLHMFEGECSSHAYPWEMEKTFNEVTCRFLNEVS